MDPSSSWHVYAGLRHPSPASADFVHLAYGFDLRVSCDLVVTQGCAGSGRLAQRHLFESRSNLRADQQDRRLVYLESTCQCRPDLRTRGLDRLGRHANEQTPFVVFDARRDAIFQGRVERDDKQRPSRLR
jgi:hypothetical protein